MYTDLCNLHVKLTWFQGECTYVRDLDISAPTSSPGFFVVLVWDADGR